MVKMENVDISEGGKFIVLKRSDGISQGTDNCGYWPPSFVNKVLLKHRHT